MLMPLLEKFVLNLIHVPNGPLLCNGPNYYVNLIQEYIRK